MSNMLNLLFAVSVTVVPSVATVGFYKYYNGDFYAGNEHKTEQVSAHKRFELLDAAELCQSRTRDIFEKELLTMNVDWRSSRYEEKRKEFVVMIEVAVGTWQDYEKGNAYCHIDGNSEKVTYSTVISDDNRVMRNGIKFSSFMGFTE